jgi:hypothetical protein
MPISHVSAATHNNGSQKVQAHHGHRHGGGFPHALHQASKAQHTAKTSPISAAGKK